MPQTFKIINIKEEIGINVSTRYENYEGRPHMVVHAVILTEGVHNDLFYPADELAKFVASWNGIPVPVHHPEVDGMPIPANSPDVIAGQVVGRFWNATFEDNKLSGEIWLDVAKTQNLAPEVIDMVKSGSRLEVSTGLFLDEDFVSGNWNGEDYDSTVRNYRPDHLALLPGSIGACSWEDGCGVRDNIDDDEQIIEKGGNVMTELEELQQLADEEIMKDTKKKFSIFSKIAKALGFKAQELSHDGLRRKLQGAVDNLDTPPEPSSGKYHYVREVFDDYLIMEVHQEGEEPKLFKQNFKVSENDEVELDGDPKEVKQDVSYVALESNKGTQDVIDNDDNTDNDDNIVDNDKPDADDSDDADGITDNKDKGGKATMCCEEKVNALIENEQTNYTEDDREWLMTMEEDQIDKMVPVVKEEPTDNADDTHDDKPADNADDASDTSDENKAPSLDEILEQSGDHKEMIEDGLKMFREKKDKLIKAIIDNEANVYTAAELKDKPMAEIEKIAALAKIEPNTDYSGGAGGAQADGDRPKANEKQEDGSGVPDPIKPKWNKDGSPDFSDLD